MSEVVGEDTDWEVDDSSSSGGSDLHTRQVPDLNFGNNPINLNNRAEPDTQLWIGQSDVPLPNQWVQPNTPNPGLVWAGFISKYIEQAMHMV